MIRVARSCCMLLATLALLAATLIVGRSPARASNAFCAASVRVWSQSSPSNYLVSLASHAKSAVDARVTFITKSDAWSATIHATPAADSSSSTDDRLSKPVLVYVPAGQRVEYAYVDGAAIDGAALSDCATVVDGTEDTNAPAAREGTGVMATRLEALPPLSCASLYTPGKANRLDVPRIGDYHTDRTVLVRITIDSNGRAVESSIYKSSGIDGIDEAARAAAMNGIYQPPTFLCQRVPGVYLVRLEYHG